MRVCVSGYSGYERAVIERLSKELGCKFNDKLTRRTKVLVCCDCKSEKFVKAEEWEVECVGIDWLYAAAKEGRRPETSAATPSSPPSLSQHAVVGWWPKPFA